MFGRPTHIELSSRVSAVAHDDLLEYRFGFLGNYAIGLQHQRFAEIAKPRRRLAEKPDRVAVSTNGVIIARETHVNRRNDFPAAAILWRLLQMRLDARDHCWQ